MCGKSLGQSSEDDQDKLKAVHPLTTDEICKNTESDLTNDSSRASCDLDSSIGVVGDFARAAFGVVPENNTQHGVHHVDSEKIVRIGEETNTSYDNGTHMVPAKGCLVDFRQGETASLVRVRDMGLWSIISVRPKKIEGV